MMKQMANERKDKAYLRPFGMDFLAARRPQSMFTEETV
jgi:hypothetical protein